MRVQCGECRIVFDDAERSTICPHDRFLSPEHLAQKDLALSLLGKKLGWASGGTEILEVQSVDAVGMVTLRTYTGSFAPHLFIVRH